MNNITNTLEYAVDNNVSAEQTALELINSRETDDPEQTGYMVSPALFDTEGNLWVAEAIRVQDVQDKLLVKPYMYYCDGVRVERPKEKSDGVDNSVSTDDIMALLRGEMKKRDNVEYNYSIRVVFSSEPLEFLVEDDEKPLVVSYITYIDHDGNEVSAKEQAKTMGGMDLSFDLDHNDEDNEEFEREVDTDLGVITEFNQLHAEQAGALDYGVPEVRTDIKVCYFKPEAIMEYNKMFLGRQLLASEEMVGFRIQVGVEMVVDPKVVE